jgi:hypothetical protein
MRRALGALVVVALVAVTPVALAESDWENYLDKFSSVSYGGSDGSLHWSKPWQEVGPERDDDPSSRPVRVAEQDGCASGRCLIIDSDPLLTVGQGAFRLADLSGFEAAKLSYAVGFDGDDDLLEEATAELVVEVTTDGGTTWVPVDIVGLGNAGLRKVDVSTFISSRFGVRFMMTGALGTSVLIDNVEIAGSVPTTTTTTTTTLVSTTLTVPPTTLTTTTTTTITTQPTTSTTSATTTTTDPGGDESTTTTTEASGASAGASGGGPDDPTGSGDGTAESSTSGLRRTSVGIESNFETGLFGPAPEVLAFDISPGYAIAVELIEAAWHWVLALALLIAAALIKGIDRRITSVPSSEAGS